jgi:hypothetical protein
MFRDAYIITEDYTVRIHLGYAIFRWWQYLDVRPRNVNEGNVNGLLINAYLRRIV